MEADFDPGSQRLFSFRRGLAGFFLVLSAIGLYMLLSSEFQILPVEIDPIRIAVWLFGTIGNVVNIFISLRIRDRDMAMLSASFALDFAALTLSSLAPLLPFDQRYIIGFAMTVLLLGGMGLQIAFLAKEARRVRNQNRRYRA